jgi:xyloglucan-specific exo-beta-1,4-glucanase
MRVTRTGKAAIVVLLTVILLGGIRGAGVFAKWAEAPATCGSHRAYEWRNVELVGGGFVPGIIFSTRQRGLVYARTDIGGAYRWSPFSKRWVPLLDWVSWDDWNLMGVESLATDPVQPNRLYIAAGTYTNEWADSNGAILRSTNYGNTFQRIDLPFKLGGNMPGRSMGERLAIDPNDNSILYLGTRSGNGLWRSTDYGTTWQKVESFTAVGNYAQNPGGSSYESDLIGVVWVVFDPSTGTRRHATQTVYVGVADTDTAIYRSTDAGETWEPVPGQPSDGFLPHHGVMASNGVLYITYSDHCGPYQGSIGAVWRFDAATGVWTNISPPYHPDATWWTYGYSGLAVDASDPDIVMVSSMESWWPDDMVFRSVDGGATWSRIWDIDWAGGWPPPRTDHYVLDISGAPWLDWGRDVDPLPEEAPKLGWMIGDLEIDPFNSDRMMYGTGATIYGSDNLTDWDAGATVTITVKARGLEETAVQDLISPPAGVHLISALSDLGGFIHEELDSAPARMLMPPTLASGTSLDYAELNPDFVVRVGNGDGMINIGFSSDGGLSWTEAATEPADVSGGGTVAAAADGSAVVWSPAGAAVSYSADGGAIWMPSAGIPAGAVVESDRVNPLKFYGFSGGSFHASVDGGASFAPTVATGLPAESPIRFKAMPGHEGDIWLAGGSDEEGIYGLWHSTDGGASFAKLANVQEADAVGFGKAALRNSCMALYVTAKIGDVRGIYRSDDGGATWVRINDDRHQYAWTGASITGDPRIYGRVYVSTNGRGIIYGDPQPGFHRYTPFCR